MELKKKNKLYQIFYLPWKKFFDQELITEEDYFIKIATFTSFCVNLVLIITNLFWVFSYTLGSSKGILNGIQIGVIALMAVISLFFFICLWPKKQMKHQRLLILLTLFLIYIEVATISSIKGVAYLGALNDMTDLTELQVKILLGSSGVPLVTFYLLAIIFIPLYRTSDCFIAVVFACISIFIQIFLPGHEVFSFKNNFIVLMSCIIGAFLVRILVLLFVKSAIKLKKEQDKYQEIIVDTFEAMSDAIDFKDSYTRGHSNRVAEVAVAIAQRIGLDEKEIKNIYYGGLIHDIGKIGIPDAILNKPGRLTDEEYAIIKEHTVNGSVLLSKLVNFPSMKAPVRWHHERYDGKGYPDGIKGENIPLIARILAVADSFDAMNSNRAYRNKLSIDDIKGELEKNKGTQFDPDIAEILINLIDEGIVK